MRHFKLGPSGDAADTAASFGSQLHNTWGVGSAACNNGVLLLLSTSDRQVYISTGEGTKALLPQKTLMQIMDNMKPALRAKRYDEALLEAVHEVALALAGQDVPGGGGSSQDEEGNLGIFVFFASIVAAVFGWGWWSNRRQTRRYKVGCGLSGAVVVDSALRCHASIDCLQGCEERCRW